MSGVTRRVLLGFAILGAVTLLLTSGLAQRLDDPRNASPEFYDAVNGANCISHHEAEGLRPMDFNIVTRYSQLPIGEDVDLELTIRHNSDLTQDLLDMAITVDNSMAPHILVITDDFVPDTENEYTESINAGQTLEVPIEVLSGAVGFNASVAAEGQPSPAASLGEVQLTVTGPGGTVYTGSGDAMAKEIALDSEAMTDSGPGTYQMQIAFNHPAPPAGGAQEFRIYFLVDYDQSGSKFRFEPAEGEPTAIRGSDPNNLKTTTFIIPVRATGAGEGVLDFRAEAINYWDHAPGDGAPSDEGLFYRFATMKVTGGDTAVRVSATSGPVDLVPTVDLYNMFARILGYIAIVLIPVSMITGGMFGKSSRRWLNKMTGGAKKRVLWHNAMSFMIIGVATLHFLLSLLEAKFAWTKGLFWGGVGWAVLISLGFTGWYQVRMIKRWNYKVWRHTHLWSAVGVLLFGVVHSVLDGSDLAFVRDVLPDWHVKLIWP